MNNEHRTPNIEDYFNELQNCKTAKLQNCKTAKLQNCKTFKIAH